MFSTGYKGNMNVGSLSSLLITIGYRPVHNIVYVSKYYGITEVHLLSKVKIHLIKVFKIKTPKHNHK